MLYKKTGHLLTTIFALLITAMLYAQDTTSSDGLLIEARKAAFNSTDYTKAKAYLNKALRISPGYADVKIFLGRIYTWTKNYDSARMYFRQVLITNPGYEDVFVAYSDLEYYNDNYVTALELARSGLRSNPGSEPLMYREARILNTQKHFTEAEHSLQKLLLINNKNKEALELQKSMQEEKNKITAGNEAQAPKPVDSKAQDTVSSDALLLLARKAAFDDKNYELAKLRLYKALHRNPGYGDVEIFLGRIHAWSKEYDSARYYFSDVLKTDPANKDASLALSDLEYWNDDNKKALQIVTDALVYHPRSEDLLLRKAKILNDLRRYSEAQIAVDDILRINRNNSEARLLANRIKESSAKNRVGFSYDYVYFDKQFSDPWHLVSFDYTRTTGIGSVTGRINYANRFRENGVQYELEAYPHISKTFYSYVNVGYSDNVGVFPQWRGGFSLYANLPKSFEGELGIRYLKFSGDPVFIYTASLGKYYKSWLFTGRTYVTPSSFTNTASASYSVSARYYYGSADDLIGATLGYGISPDDRFNSVQLDDKVRLISYKAGLTFKKKVSRLSVINIDGSWYNQEYLPQTKGNQYQFSIGWLQRF